MAAGKSVNLSMQVRMYVKPLDGGSGPTIPTHTMSKWTSGVANVERGAGGLSNVGTLGRRESTCVR